MANPTGKPHNSIFSISIHRTRQVFNIQTCRQNPQHAANERFIHPSLSISLSIGTSDACLLIALSPDIKELSTRSFLICSQIHSLYVTWLHKEQSGHLKPISVQFLTLKKGYNQEPILMQTEESIQPAFTFFHMHNNNFVVHTKQINARSYIRTFNCDYTSSLVQKSCQHGDKSHCQEPHLDQSPIVNYQRIAGHSVQLETHYG